MRACMDGHLFNENIGNTKHKQTNTHVRNNRPKPDLSFIKNYGGNPIVWQRIDEIVVFVGNGYIFHSVLLKLTPQVCVCGCEWMNE